MHISHSGEKKSIIPHIYRWPFFSLQNPELFRWWVWKIKYSFKCFDRRSSKKKKNHMSLYVAFNAASISISLTLDLMLVFFFKYCLHFNLIGKGISFSCIRCNMYYSIYKLKLEMRNELKRDEEFFFSSFEYSNRSKRISKSCTHRVIYIYYNSTTDRTNIPMI